MRAEDHARALRHFAQLLNKNCTRLPQLIDNVAVVNDLFTNIYGRSVKVKNDLHHVDCAHHSCAEAPRAEQDDLFHGTTIASLAHGVHYTSHTPNFRNGYSLLIRAAACPRGVL